MDDTLNSNGDEKMLPCAEIEDWFGLAADLAQVLTSIVAVWLWVRFILSAHRRRKALERYLRYEKNRSKDRGMRSILHLMSNLSMTEEQIYSAAFGSKCVSTVPLTNEKSGLAESILFVYRPPRKRQFSSR